MRIDRNELAASLEPTHGGLRRRPVGPTLPVEVAT
jgi:hypothetical protein